MIKNEVHDSGKWVATRLGFERVICNFAILENCSGKWDSPSNNSIVCLLPPWIDFPLIITLLLLAGWHTQPTDTCWKLTTVHQRSEWTSGCLSVAEVHTGYWSCPFAHKHTKSDNHSKAYNNDRILHACLNESEREPSSRTDEGMLPNREIGSCSKVMGNSIFFPKS